jgi:hypothetical protein
MGKPKGRYGREHMSQFQFRYESRLRELLNSLTQKNRHNLLLTLIVFSNKEHTDWVQRPTIHHQPLMMNERSTVEAAVSAAKKL